MKNHTIYLTRDSACAADDLDAPHRKKISVPGGISVEDIVMTIFREKYLPQNIKGGKATWSVASNIPIAVIAQQWLAPKMVSSIPILVDQLDVSNNEMRFHINYHAQINPELVLEVLSDLRLNAI